MLGTKPQDRMVEEYKRDLSVYKERSEKLSKLEAEKDLISKKEWSLRHAVELILFLLIVLPLAFVEHAIFSSFIESRDLLSILVFWGSILSAGFLADRIFRIGNDSISNAFSLGRINKLKKKTILAKEEVRLAAELKNHTREKLKLFEKPTADHYQALLDNLFKNNLFNKRSGSQLFEESLVEFASMIEEVSVINSKFVTTHIFLDEYREYLKKRSKDHTIQTSKDSENLISISNFVSRLTKTEELPRRPLEKRPVMATSKPASGGTVLGDHRGFKSRDITPPEVMYRTARKVDNWLEINKRRQLTGLKGEEIVVEVEREFFKSIGRLDLADKICHVSVESGDGEGFDIRSFFKDGREKYIEVKSTTASLQSPYFLSRNELGFLKENRDSYFIYRVLISVSIPEIKIFSSSEVLEMSEIIPTQYMVKMK